MNIPFPNYSNGISITTYDARKELITRLIKENKITIDEALILLTNSTPAYQSTPSITFTNTAGIVQSTITVHHSLNKNLTDK